MNGENLHGKNSTGWFAMLLIILLLVMALSITNSIAYKIADDVSFPIEL